MQFPLFQIPFLGNGLSIGLNAVVHVFLSHGVAIGMFGTLLLAEWSAFRADHTGDASVVERDRFNWSVFKLMVIVITIFGAVTGAGIWFTIGPLASRATGSMLRIFFWPWFAEWLVFVTEVFGILILYYAWHRMKRSWRVLFVGGYFCLAAFSAVLITGILGFMLTPGTWPETANLWNGFLNPSFLPQVAARLGISIFLGAGFFTALLLAKQRQTASFRKELLPLLGWYYLFGLLLFAVGISSYLIRVPLAHWAHARFAVLTSHFSQAPWLFWALNGIALATLAFHALSVTLARERLSRWLLLPSLLLMLALVTEFERIREFVRGPYIMPGHMYASGVRIDEHLLFSRSGMLPFSPWAPSDPDPARDRILKGAWLFGQNCGACHTVGGINDIRDRLRGRTRDGILVILRHTHEMVPFMPPFSGNEEEQKMTADFLYGTTRGRLPMESLSRLRPDPGELKGP